MYKILDINGNVVETFSDVYDAHWRLIDIIGKQDYIRVFALNGVLNYSVALDTDTNCQNVIYTIKGEDPITCIPYNLFVKNAGVIEGA